MTNIQVAFNFTLHQKVIVKEIFVIGYVVGLIVEDLGKQYRVRYWHEGERKVEWFFSDEIEEDYPR